MTDESGLAPGWYPHKQAAADTLRYWDGSSWTDNYKPAEGAADAQPIPGWLTFVGYATMLLMPIVGFVIGIHHLTRKRQGDGVVLIVGSVLAGALFFAMFTQPDQF